MTTATMPVRDPARSHSDDQPLTFKVHDRVIIRDTVRQIPLRGRHGEIIEVHSFRFGSVVGNSYSSRTVYYDVRTDAGAVLSIATNEDLRPEDCDPPPVINDPSVMQGRNLVTAIWTDVVRWWQNEVDASFKYRRSADRRRKEANRLNDIALAERCERRADALMADFWRWISDNGQDAVALAEGCNIDPATLPKSMNQVKQARYERQRQAAAANAAKAAERVAEATWSINTERSGVEIRFPDKPDRGVLDVLKANGWRWARRNACWYHRDTPSAREFAKKLCSTAEAA